jgi:phosphatidylglycerophosphate synthase
MALGGRSPGPLVTFLTSAADRLFDGLILSALAWANFVRRPMAAGLAVAALSLSFLGAYVRARGQALGYPVEESAVNRGVRYVLVATGLITERIVPALWMLTVLVGLTTAVRVSQVAKQERE